MLRPEHAAYLDEVCFTPAKFNVGLDEIEKSIITSTGEFLVVFNFRKACHDGIQSRGFAALC